MNTQQLAELSKMADNWEYTAKISNYLWKHTATIIANSCKYVMNGSASLVDFKAKLSEMVKSSENMAIQSYYESALQNVTNILILY